MTSTVQLLCIWAQVRFLMLSGSFLLAACSTSEPDKSRRECAYASFQTVVRTGTSWQLEGYSKLAAHHH